MPGPPTIVVVDDAPEVRLLVKTQLRLSGRLQVVGEGADGYDAVELAQTHRPALMLLDVSMPGRDGLAALPLVLDASPTTRVVMFSGFDEAGLADHTRSLGATEFLEKSVPLDQLVERLVGIADREPSALPSAPAPTPAPSPAAAPAPPVLDPVLEEHLERFREVFEDAAIGMATLTLDGRVVRANRHLTHLLDEDAHALVGTAYADLALDPGEVRAALERLREGGEAVQLEHRLLERPERLCRATVSAVLDAQQRPLYFFLQAQDVTGQRAAEAELRATERRFRLLVETVQDYAIFMLDPEGHVASWNAGAQRTKGWTAEEIIGRHFRVFYPEEKQREQHPEHELRVARRDGRYEEEGWRVRKDGSTFWAHVTITAVHDERGVLVGFAKVTRDSTERRRMLELQQQANLQLRLAAEEQAGFLAVTAHELRSPVGVLAATAETMARHHDQLTAEERREFAEGMRRTADQLRRLLEDLLTASRAQARSLGLAPARVPVAEHLRALVAATRGSLVDAAGGTHAGPDADLDDRHADLRIELDVAPDLAVRVDPGRFTQMVDNLLVNALRHGRPPVTVAAEARGETVLVSVRDSGAGVPVERRERLFERFGTTSGGTGLGLYIVRELARASGGDATYRPEDHAFVLALPRDPA